jgi:hypothetical protein
MTVGTSLHAGARSKGVGESGLRVSVGRECTHGTRSAAVGPPQKRTRRTCRGSGGVSVGVPWAFGGNEARRNDDDDDRGTGRR